MSNKLLEQIFISHISTHILTHKLYAHKCNGANTPTLIYKYIFDNQHLTVQVKYTNIYNLIGSVVVTNMQRRKDIFL